MRRIFTLVIMVLTMLLVVGVSLPSINENKTLGMDYKGGFEILYEVTPKAGSGFDASTVTTAAAEGISKRLEIAGITSYDVNIEGGNYIRVGVTTASLNDMNDTKAIIESGSEISFRDTDNNLLATGEEILNEGAASVSTSTDYYGYYYINLSISDVSLLEDITTTIANDSGSLVIWLGYQEGDDYANKDSDNTIANKIIYDATVSQALAEDTIVISGSFTKEEAKTTAELINSGTYEYDMNYLQMSQIDANLGEEAYNRTLIAMGIALLVVMISLIVAYRGAGLFSAISLLFSVFLSLVLFNVTNGVFAVNSVAALVVGIALAVDAVVVILERVKKEIRSGKEVSKAYSEGLRKSIPSVIDANIATFIVAAIIFFLGSSTLKTFSSMLIFTIVSVMISMLVINSIVLYAFSKSPLCKTSSFFGLSKKHKEKVKDVEKKHKDRNINNISKKYLIGAGAFVSLALVASMLFNFVFNMGFFNFSNDFKEGSIVTVETYSNYFTNEDDFITFLVDDGIETTPYSVEFSSILDSETSITSYVVTAEFDNSILSYQTAMNDTLASLFGENSQIETNYKLYVQATSNQSTLVTFTNAAIVSLVVSLAVALYLTLRYRYTYGLAAFFTILHNIIVTFAFFTLFRIQIDSSFVPAIIAIISYSVNLMVLIFSRLKEFLSSNSKKYISNEERLIALNKSLEASLSKTVVSMIIVTLLLIALISVSLTTSLSFHLALIIGIVVSSISSYLVASHLWLLFEKHKEKRRRTFKPKHHSHLFVETEEKVFIGIND